MNRIKQIREVLGIQQTELAKLAKISQPYLFDLENNRRGARPETMQRIADTLGVTVNDLIGKDGEDGKVAVCEGDHGAVSVQSGNGAKADAGNAAHGKAAARHGKSGG